MKLSSSAILLSLLIAPVVPGQAALAADPAPEVATPSDLGCVMRMMNLSTMAGKSAKDPAKSAEDRAKADGMVTDARRAVFYYVGRLGPGFGAGDRAAEGDAQFKLMKATPNDKLAMEMAICMTNAEDAEQAAMQAMMPKSKTK